MNEDIGYRRLAWGTALFEIVLLSIVAVVLFLAPDHSLENWLFVQVRAIVQRSSVRSLLPLRPT